MYMYAFSSRSSLDIIIILAGYTCRVYTHVGSSDVGLTDNASTHLLVIIIALFAHTMTLVPLGDLQSCPVVKLP